jgi:hypothetical protein
MLVKETGKLLLLGIGLIGYGIWLNIKSIAGAKEVINKTGNQASRFNDREYQG